MIIVEDKNRLCLSLCPKSTPSCRTIRRKGSFPQERALARPPSATKSFTTTKRHVAAGAAICSMLTYAAPALPFAAVTLPRKEAMLRAAAKHPLRQQR